MAREEDGKEYITLIKSISDVDKYRAKFNTEDEKVSSFSVKNEMNEMLFQNEEDDNENLLYSKL